MPTPEDLNPDMHIGLKIPIRKGDIGYFDSTKTHLEQAKYNLRNLLLTVKGERIMQPNLGINLRKHLFEQFTDEKRITVQNEILDTFNYWLPFVKIKKLDIDMSETDPIGKNKLSIFILFNIVQDPNTTESIQMVIEGE